MICGYTVLLLRSYYDHIAIRRLAQNTAIILNMFYSIAEVGRVARRVAAPLGFRNNLPRFQYACCRCSDEAIRFHHVSQIFGVAMRRRGEIADV